MKYDNILLKLIARLININRIIMSKKINCWEYLKCGREPGGDKVDKYGVCPAATRETHDGFNEGMNGGRICWNIAGTLCHSNVDGLFAKNLASCMQCDFLKLVRDEEDNDFMMLAPEDNI